MRIAIIGYGRMGKVIEQKALERGHEISGKITSHNADQLPEVLKKSDAAIEFTVPKAAGDNIKLCADHNVPVIVGTTGWYDSFNEIKEYLKERKGTMLYATNFSVGVNITFKLNQILAKIMNKQKMYAPEIEEIHHIHKLDAPSGTAITLAEGLIDNYEGKTNWKLNGSERDDELAVYAKRENEVPGTHTVRYECDIDKITLKHEAKSRDGFALGSVLAAEFCTDKQGIFTMQDMLQL